MFEFFWYWCDSGSFLTEHTFFFGRLCYPIPSAENQIARDLSHREAHRTFREDFQSLAFTRRRARSRLASRPFRARPETRNLLYPRQQYPAARGPDCTWIRKTPLSDRVLAGSNLGAKNVFFTKLTGQSAGWIRTLRSEPIIINWRVREKNRGKTGLALHRPNLKRVRGFL